MIRRLALAAMLLPGVLSAQSRQEYAARRMALETKLPQDGVLVALGAQEPSQDHLSFYQAPSFYYLTGFKEPDAALVMIKRGGQIVSSTMFVRPRQPSREVWTGTRLGTEGIWERTGIRGRPANELWPMLDSLGRAGQSFHFIGEFGSQEGDEEGPTRVSRTADQQLVDRLKRLYPTAKIEMANEVIEQMRGTKTATELALIRQAVDITARALKEAMSTLKDGMNEFEIQALIEYTFRRNGADRPSFATIVGSGPNSTTLHYNTDDRFIGPNDLVVMDVGASYKGYAADITRTVPASGHFSTSQRDVYQIVREAQGAAERQMRIGMAARILNDSANAVLASGLARLKLIESPGATYDCSTGDNPRQCPQYRMYYMHGLGHGIGLEVHDPDQYYYSANLAPGSVFTIEPGLYVRERVLEEMPNTPRNREIAARLRPSVTFYKNVGVRIEDNYAVTEKGVERLSQGVPREIAEIEALMKAATPSPAKRDGALVERYRAQ